MRSRSPHRDQQPPCGPTGHTCTRNTPRPGRSARASPAGRRHADQRPHRRSFRGPRDPPHRATDRARAGTRQPVWPLRAEVRVIRVLLADDEALIRAGIRLILANAGDVEIVAEGADGVEAVDLARRHQPDVALIDIRMPKLDGIATAREIQRPGIRTHVVMLTTFGEDANVAQALQAGAVGFLLKDT